MSSSSSVLRVVQVGVGNWGAVRRAALRETGLFDLVGLYDHNPEFLSMACAQEEVPGASSYEELLSMPGVEAVIIATGAKFHAEQALLAMERGLHVFMEKPVCATLSELHALLKKQAETGLVVGLGHKDHSSIASSRTTKRLIESGGIGDVVAFEATTAHGGGFQMKEGDWRADPHKNPGGMLFQCGVHTLHELAFYFGPVSEVYSSMRYDLHTTRTADAAVCQLKYASGVVGSLHAYHVTPYRHTLNIYGTKANLYRNNRSAEEELVFEKQSIRLDNGIEPAEPLELDAAGCENGNLRSFHAGVRKGTAVYPSLRDGALALSVVFAAEESARRGQPVRMEEFFSGLSVPSSGAETPRNAAVSI
jgi:UDP-N-acetylglucosamine 3-dehydrogenase